MNSGNLLVTTKRMLISCFAALSWFCLVDGAETPESSSKGNMKIPKCHNACSSDTVMDCADILHAGHSENGIMTIWPKSRVIEGCPLNVYCDMETDGGGWTVIQRRGNFSRPKDFFSKGWSDYKKGFGNIEKDFWLGNDNIFALSNQKLYSVRFDLQDVEGNRRYAMYDAFWIDGEDHQYMLHIKDYSGDAGDSMTAQHDGQKFSAKDKDNDNLPEEFCSERYKGGWWYNTCHHSNLNGLYLGGKTESYADGINWHSWKGYKESLATTEIKIRPRRFIRQGCPPPKCGDVPPQKAKEPPPYVMTPTQIH